jgi:hypothetical protein
MALQKLGEFVVDGLCRLEPLHPWEPVYWPLLHPEQFQNGFHLNSTHIYGTLQGSNDCYQG